MKLGLIALGFFLGWGFGVLVACYTLGEGKKHDDK